VGLVFGTAPDSWGVWLDDHASQPPWRQFLDEVREAGYNWIELGPYGYLPTDVHELREELESRDIKLLAGTLVEDLHFRSRRPALWEQATRICDLVSELGGSFLVLIPNMYRDSDGRFTGPRELDDAGWKTLIATTEELGRIVRDDYGLKLSFHPHADTAVEYNRHVDRLLNETDGDAVHLCLDTGHLEYRDGDSAALMRERFERIPYLHLTSLDPSLKGKVNAEDIDFPTAVRLGLMCEPAVGTVDFTRLDAAMTGVSWDGWAIVEQDMFPLDDVDRPLPIAKRTRQYFNTLGWSC
jgi:inosose dehydratase